MARNRWKKRKKEEMIKIKNEFDVPDETPFYAVIDIKHPGAIETTFQYNEKFFKPLRENSKNLKFTAYK